MAGWFEFGLEEMNRNYYAERLLIWTAGVHNTLSKGKRVSNGKMFYLTSFGPARQSSFISLKHTG
jgi:hypothetical protein